MQRILSPALYHAHKYADATADSIHAHTHTYVHTYIHTYIYTFARNIAAIKCTASFSSITTRVFRANSLCIEKY